MIKRFIGIVIPLLTFTTLIGQDYVMFNTGYLELKEGQHVALQEGVKRHNAKFHSGEMAQVHIFGMFILDQMLVNIHGQLDH